MSTPATSIRPRPRHYIAQMTQRSASLLSVAAGVLAGVAASFALPNLAAFIVAGVAFAVADTALRRRASASAGPMGIRQLLLAIACATVLGVVLKAIQGFDP
jgi:hypothetical protein